MNSLMLFQVVTGGARSMKAVGVRSQALAAAVSVSTESLYSTPNTFLMPGEIMSPSHCCAACGTARGSFRAHLRLLHGKRMALKA